jgi:hypothetical protein
VDNTNILFSWHSEFLINLISPKIVKKDTAYRATVPVEERLAVTMWFLAIGDSYISLQYLLQFLKPAIGQIISEAHSLH